MANTLVFTPNAACSNTINIEGIIPGMSHDHTWFVEKWNCVAPGSLDEIADYGTNTTSFRLWFTSAAGVLLLTVSGTNEGLATGYIRFPMTGAETELLRGQTIGRCGAGWVDSQDRKMPIESGRYHVEDWPAISFA